MLNRLYLWSLCLLLLSCQTENSENAAISENSDPVTTEQTGDGSLNLNVRNLSYNENTPGPVYATLNLTLEEGTTLQVWLDSVQIVNEAIACQVIPAGTFCSSSRYYAVSFIVTEGGTHQFDVRLSKENSWTGQSFQYSINQSACLNNETVYQQSMQPVLQNNCAGCHGNGNAGTFSANDDWSVMSNTLRSKGELFYQVPSGEYGQHDGGVRFQPNDGTYRLFAEMLWRADNNFSCSQ